MSEIVRVVFNYDGGELNAEKTLTFPGHPLVGSTFEYNGNVYKISNVSNPRSPQDMKTVTAVLK